MTIKSNFDRRTFLRGTAAAAAALPLSGLLNSTSAFAQDAANPFGVAEGSTVDAVIFNGGYGIDYVEFAANLMKENHPSLNIMVSPSTQIAQELQPRFLGGNPPDLIDNSGAQAIGFSAIIDQLEDMNSVLDAPSLEGVTIRDTLVGGVEKPGTFGDKFVALNYVMTVYAIWYSAQLFEDNGWTPPTTWAEAIELGAKAKEKDLYLFGWGREAATYYRTTAVASAIKEGGDEVRLAVAEPDHQRRTEPGADQHVGMGAKRDRQRERAAQLREHGLDRLLRRRPRFDLLRHQVRDDFRVRFAFELAPARNQRLAQRLEVLDDAVVDQRHFTGRVGVGIVRGRGAVGGPPGVRDAHFPCRRVAPKFALQVGELALGAAPDELAAMQRADAGAVIAAVFHAAQPLDQAIRHGLVADDADDSAHG